MREVPKVKESSKSPKRSKRREFVKRTLVVLVIIFTCILTIAGGTFLYLRNWIGVFAVVKGSLVHSYSYKYVENQISDKYGFSTTVMNPADPKSTYYSNLLKELTTKEVIARRLLFLEGMKEGIEIGEMEVKSELERFKSTLYVSEGQNIDDVYRDYLERINITEKQLLEILRESAVADKVIAKITGNITVSETDVRAFFKDFASAYQEGDESEKEAFENHYDAIKRDALKAKVDDFVRDYKNKVYDEAVSKGIVQFDTPYKRVVRWWYKNFLGLALPEEYSEYQLP